MKIRFIVGFFCIKLIKFDVLNRHPGVHCLFEILAYIVKHV